MKMTAKERYEKFEKGKRGARVYVPRKNRWHGTREARLASQRVRDAVRYGKLVKPEGCEHCFIVGKILCGHHKDYKKPLEVIWLCHSCHAAEHNK
jgi:hypothetical protein